MPYLIELFAVISSAVYGVLLARRHKMDFVGVFSLAFVVAFGGGTLRDLFLGRHPLFWIEQSHYPIVVLVIAFVTTFVPRLTEKSEKFLSLPDAFGLGLFSIAGVNAAIDSGTSYFVATLMGAVTGTFGGVIGDIICNRVPSLFRPAPMFATCSFTGCWVYLLLNHFPQTKGLADATAIGVIVIFRLLSIRYGWYLPNFESSEDDLDENA